VTDVYDSLDHHLKGAGSFERAAVPPGIYLAWCINMGLESRMLHERDQQAVLRVRYRELKGSEFLVSVCGGVLDASLLSDAGRRFTRTHYQAYLDALQALAPDECVYDYDDDWALYERMASFLTRQYMGGGSQKRRWWRFWR
jgi:hypothetical protein|tara:strand:- start:804 stop:1229 length:426 start_codon:yes stop_codon:yes gene_type:complete